MTILQSSSSELHTENCFRRRIRQCKWSGYSSSRAVLTVAYIRDYICCWPCHGVHPINH